MTKLEKVIDSLGRCTCRVPDACRDCAYDDKPAPECWLTLERDALELLKEQEAVKPNRGLLDNYYCGICGRMITASIKIFDGERYMIGHPDHLKPEHKWKYCKNCGRAVKWG